MNLMSISDQIIGKIIAIFRRWLDARQFRYQESLFERSASWAAPVAALLGLMLAVVAAIKTDSLAAALAGFAWLVLICVAYYIGRQFLGSCKRLIDNNPSAISSGALLESAGLIGIIVLIGTVLSALYMAIKLSSFTPLFIGIFAAGGAMYYISFMLNPELISTTVDEHATAGDDAIAIMVIMYKCSVKLASIVFGTTLIVGSLMIAQSMYKLLSGDWLEVLGGGLQSMTGVMVVLGGLMYPLVISVSFTFFYLLADLCKAILTLHGRQGGQHAAPQPGSPTPSADESAAEGMSSAAARAVVIGLVALVLIVAGVIKGKAYYAEHQAAVEAQRLEAEQKLSEEVAQKAEEAKLAAEKAEQSAKTEAFARNARQYIGKPAQDLVLDKEVNAHLRELFSTNLTAFESYFMTSDAVTEDSGLLLASGCRKENCAQNKALTVVDLKAAKVYAAVYYNDKVNYWGLTDEEELALPAAVKKWALAVNP